MILVGIHKEIHLSRFVKKIQISFSCFIKYNVEKHCWGAHVKMITKVHRGVGPNDYSITYMGGGLSGPTKSDYVIYVRPLR